jgi:hypothetical protein
VALPVVKKSPFTAVNRAKSVMFQLGRSSRATMPLATGSPALAKTIGIVRVSRWKATVTAIEFAAMMSGCKPTNSCASARIRLGSPPPHRTSIRTLRPSVQPKPASACVNAETSDFARGIVFVELHEHADAPHAVALLRARCERPRRRATESSDEFPSPDAEHGRWLASSCARPEDSTRRGCQIGVLHCVCCTAESRSPPPGRFMAEMGHVLKCSD